jgi:hypothetical protein
MHDEHLYRTMSAHPKLQFIHKTYTRTKCSMRTTRAAVKQNVASDRASLFVTFQLVGYLVDGINLVHRESKECCPVHIVKLTLSFPPREKRLVVSRVGTLLSALERCFVLCSPALQQHGSSQSSWLIVPLSRTHYCPADNPLSYGV